MRVPVSRWRGRLKRLLTGLQAGNYGWDSNEPPASATNPLPVGGVPTRKTSVDAETKVAAKRAFNDSKNVCANRETE